MADIIAESKTVSADIEANWPIRGGKVEWYPPGMNKVADIIAESKSSSADIEASRPIRVGKVEWYPPEMK